MADTSLTEALLHPSQAAAMGARGGRTEAAVLIPMHGWPEAPGLVFTERRADLRRHPGEISFPGGRRDPGEELLQTALREADEEIGLRPERVEVAGALPPFGTFVSNYKVHPFVGLIEPGLSFTPNPDEVESVIVASLDELVEAFELRRLVRRGIPFRTETFQLDGALIWGATGRILAELLDRLRPGELGRSPGHGNDRR